MTKTLGVIGPGKHFIEKIYPVLIDSDFFKLNGILRKNNKSFKNIKLFHLSWGFTKAIGKGKPCVFNKYSKVFVLRLEMINRALTVFNKKHKTDFYIDLSGSICLMQRHHTLSEYESIYIKNNVINFEHIYRKIEEAYNSPIELGWNSEEEL